MRPLDPRLIRHARAARAYLAVCLALGLASAALIVVTATLLATGIARIFPIDHRGVGLETAPLGGLDDVLAAICLVVVARAAIAWTQEIAAHRAAAMVKSELRSALLTRLARLGPGWLTSQRSGALVTLSGFGLDALDAYFSRYLPQLVLAAVVPVIVLAKIMPADQIAGWTIIVTLPLIPLFMVLIGLHSQRASSRRFAMLSRLSHHFLDVVSGLPTLKAYRRTAAQETTIRTVTNAYRSMTMRTLRIAFLSSFTLELVATLSVALVAVGIGLRLVSGTLDYPTALLVLILAPEAYAPIRQVSTNFHAATEGLAAASDVFAVLETPVPAQRGGTALPDLARAPISLVDLTVRYPERSSPVFSDLNLSVAPGEIVALTGRSGCGKSTILAALMGFIEPERGRVMIGSTPLADLDLVALRRSIAWVPQRPWLFSGTIMDNIRLGQPEACPEAVRLAARAAGAERFIDELPDGFATVLAEGGGGLSAGQRQRLALARAFLRDAPLVLLDEPTANLDGETEAGILRAVRSLTRGRTVILAAHRAALTGLADREVPL